VSCQLDVCLFCSRFSSEGNVTSSREWKFTKLVYNTSQGSHTQGYFMVCGYLVLVFKYCSYTVHNSFALLTCFPYPHFLTNT